MAELESAEEFAARLFDACGSEEAASLEGLEHGVAGPVRARDAAIALAAKLEALCEMHHTAMRLRKYGREPEWLGAAFTELRARYEGTAAEPAVEKESSR